MNIKKIPKADLHIHLGGAYPLSYLKELANTDELENMLSRINQGIAYKDVFYTFDLVRKIVDTEEKIKNGIKSLLNELKEDNVIYAEIRFRLKDFGNGKESYLVNILETIDGTIANPILSLRRDSSINEVNDILTYSKKYGIGVDISGNENKGELSVIHVPSLTIHIGETEQDCYEQLKQMNPRRVAHAVKINEQTKNLLYENNTHIEICLTSNIKTKLAKYSNHPVREYHNRNISICTDDPLIFQTNLTKELELYREMCNATDEDLLAVTLNAVNSSFTNKEEKKRLRSELNDYMCFLK